MELGTLNIPLGTLNIAIFETDDEIIFKNICY